MNQYSIYSMIMLSSLLIGACIVLYNTIRLKRKSDKIIDGWRRMAIAASEVNVLDCRLYVKSDFSLQKVTIYAIPEEESNAPIFTLCEWRYDSLEEYRILEEAASKLRQVCDLQKTIQKYYKS